MTGSFSDGMATAVVGPIPRTEPEPNAQPRPRTTDVGRYVMLEELGRGGMGRVTRAYDPKLQREVALKELRSATLSREGTERLVAEARAMAKLSHPNVVAVYDVEELPFDDVVIVMEYVAGGTLKQWLGTGPHPWREIVARFVAAGRGLAAAHRAGLLHRDFKPTNVMVDGSTVKVTDFGLAKNKRRAAEHGDTRGDEDSASPTLTQAGMVVGTLRYMAPEQHRGDPLTPAADQYALCVSLWEALCGEPPFDASGTEELEALKSDGPPPWPQSAVPRAVSDAIRRGLAPEPDRRWPTVEALLDALAHDPARRRNRALFGLSALALVATAGLGWRAWADARADRCSGARARLQGAWDDERRDAVREAILGIGASYATEVWEHTAATLDPYADAWVAMHEDACEATTIRGEQSAAVMDLRMACLQRARDELAAVTDVLEHADADVVRKAHEVVTALRPLSRCADVSALTADTEAPTSAEAPAVADAEQHLASSTAELKAGHYEASQREAARARQILADVDYGPIQTELAFAEAEASRAAGDYPAAEAGLRRALKSGSTWQQWRSMAKTASQLMYVVGFKQQRTAEALSYRELALGLAADDPALLGQALNNLSTVLNVAGKPAEAEVVLREALQIREKVLPAGHPGIASSHNNLAVVLAAQGKLEEAEAESRRTIALQEDSLGPDHPEVAASRNNLATILYSQGELQAATTEFHRAIEIWSQAVGPDHPDVAMAHNNLGGVYMRLGELDQAQTELTRALEIRTAAFGAESPDVAGTRHNLARLHFMQGKREQAIREHQEAIEILERAGGPDHPWLKAWRSETFDDPSSP